MSVDFEYLNEEQWKNEELLYNLYWNEKLTQREIAEEFGCHQQTISRWMDRLDISTRKDVGVHHHIEERDGRLGYEKWCYARTTVLVHKLLAVAEYGFEAVCNADGIHHKTGYKFDNRHENLDIVSHSEHGRLHSNEADFVEIDGFPQLTMNN